MRTMILLAMLVLVGSAWTSTASAQGRSNRDERRGRTVETDEDDRRTRGRSDDDGEVRSARRDEMGRRGTRQDQRTRRADRRDDDRDDDDWDEDDDRGILGKTSGSHGKKGKGPKFCRNGNGHPVHGREWCVYKGFGLGNDLGVWERRGCLVDIMLPSPRRRNNDLGGSVLDDILGDVILGRLNTQARRMNADGPLFGRMNNDSELRIFAGSTPIARFVDTDGDRRADAVYLRR